MGKDEVQIITVLMGLGHVRAAYALKDISNRDIIIYGSRKTTSPKEYKIWRRFRKTYYFLSRSERIPIIGKYLLAPMEALEDIEPYYPVRDMSKPNLPVKYLNYLIKKKGFCAGLKEKFKGKNVYLVHTFYATAVAMDNKRKEGNKNYLLICDTDFNRVWVPINPDKSRIKYLAPCQQVRRRLLSYGVKEENIFLTGFPLPRENIGSRNNLEILKEDLWKRLLKLDPKNSFLSIYKNSVFNWLNKKALPRRRKDHFSLTFAIGGAGAQVEMVDKILKSLKEKIKNGKVNLLLSAGIQKRVFETILGYINSHGLIEYLDKSIFIIFDSDVYKYLNKFNKAMRKTDVLWTKPSELSFYAGLGIPILIAPPIGPQERSNKKWLIKIHAGIEPPGPPEYAHQWLFDLREDGVLAEAAWSGFLQVKKLGSYEIEDIIKSKISEKARRNS